MTAGLLELFRQLAVPFIWWIVIAPWEQLVRVRCGKSARLLGPGVHLRIPFLDRCYVVATRLRIISDTGQTVMTRDGKAVTISASIQFSVRDALQLFETVSNPEATVSMRVQAAIAAAVRVAEASALEHEQIERAATVSIPSEWGLSEVSVHITSFAIVRTYRLLQHEYRSYSGLDQAMSKEDERR